MSSGFIDWYRRLYEVDVERCCPPVHLERHEQAIGLRLPDLLRDVYLHTSLRQSEMLRRWSLPERILASLRVG